MTSSPRGSGRYGIAEIGEVLAAHAPNIEASKRADRNAATAMILRERSPGVVETLFIKRAEHAGDPWSGQMAFPGGHRDAGDRTLEGAALRETFEEVGLGLRSEMGLGRLHDIEGGRLSTFRLSVSPFVFHHPNPPELTLNHEVSDAVWVPLEYLGDVRNVRPYLFSLDPMQREFPSFQYNGYVIWGLTYRILTSFFELFGTDLPGESEMTSAD